MDFNEIKNTWKNSYEDNRLDASQIEARLHIKTRSHNIIDKIKRNYIIGMVMLIMVYIVFLVGVAVYLLNPVGLFIFVAITLFFTWAFRFSYSSYTRIKKTIVTDDTIRPALKKIIAVMERSLRFGTSNYYKYILIPVSLIIGMSIGIYIGRGDKTWLETVYSLETRSIVKIILVFVIGSAVTIPYSQFMIKRMYKNNLDDLKKCLSDLEENEPQQP